MRMLSNRFLVPTLILTAGATATLANSTGPIPAVTGAPRIAGRSAELTCNQSTCHQGNPLNLDGSLQILGLPDPYVPGNTYSITVRLGSNATQVFVTRRWGFEITGVRLSDGLSTGAFSSGSLRVVSLSGRTYVTHNATTFQAGAQSPVQWSFNWTAPEQDEGDVAFYAAGNAANGNGTNLGDFIYTAAGTTFGGGGVPVQRATWGRIKQLFDR